MELKQGRWYRLFSYDTAREILREQEPELLVNDTILGISKNVWEDIERVTPDMHLLYMGRCRFWTATGLSLIIPVCCVRPQAMPAIYYA